MPPVKATTGAPLAGAGTDTKVSLNEAAVAPISVGRPVTRLVDSTEANRGRIPQGGVMTFYLSNNDVRPTGFEPAEFIEPDVEFIEPAGPSPKSGTEDDDGVQSGGV